MQDDTVQNRHQQQQQAAAAAAEQAEEMAAEAGTALAGRQTLEAMGGAERIADALELAAAEAERAKVCPSHFFVKILRVLIF